MMNSLQDGGPATGPAPPPLRPPLRPPDVTHVMNDTTFFAALLHPCIIVNGNRRTEKRGRPGNEANLHWLSVMVC